MTDTQGSPGNETRQPGVAAPARQRVSADIEEGKPLAILSFALTLVGIPFFLIPLFMRNNEFALFHAKQCLVLWLGAIAVLAVGLPLIVLCIGIVLVPLAAILLLALNVMGLIYAVNGEVKALPLIGQWGVEWFKGIRKV